MSNFFKISQIDGAVPEKSKCDVFCYGENHKKDCKHDMRNQTIDTFANTELEVDVEELASILANQRACRNGGLKIKNVLDILPQRLKDEVMADAKELAAQLPKILKVRKG